MIIEYCWKIRERPWMVRVRHDYKARCNHLFLVYRDSHVKQVGCHLLFENIKDLITTVMQHAFIMTSIRQNYSGSILI